MAKLIIGTFDRVKRIAYACTSARRWRKDQQFVGRRCRSTRTQARWRGASGWAAAGEVATPCGVLPIRADGHPVANGDERTLVTGFAGQDEAKRMVASRKTWKDAIVAVS